MMRYLKTSVKVIEEEDNEQEHLDECGSTQVERSMDKHVEQKM